MKIINYSIIFSSLFIITACGTNSKIVVPVSDPTETIIKLCTAGYTTKSSTGVGATYNKHEVNVSTNKTQSGIGNIDFTKVEGESAAKVHKNYVECMQNEKNREHNNGSYTSITRKQSPDINVSNSNNPSNININYEN